MKKVLVIGVLALGLALFAQEITHETMVVNIEVPVRVLKGGNFIDSLTIDDFEVFEDGVPQRIEAVYLIKKKSIERREEKTRFLPETSRNFYLFFEITEYTGKVGDALDYFINNVMVPGDNLTVVTPMKTYRMKSETFDVLSKEQIQNQFVKILRRDTLEGSAEYRNAVNELTGLAKALSSGSNSQDEFGTAEYDGLELDVQIMMYADLLKRLEQVRMVDQKKLLEFAEYLKDMEGQKYVFFFYQREYIPQIDQRTMNQYMSLNQDREDILHSLTELFSFHRRDITFDIDIVKQAYADSSVAIHFLFFAKPADIVPGVHMEEHSEDIYNAFKEIAEATGGLTESSNNPLSLFQNAVEASENYYLLYYSPKNFMKDGKFKEIKVRVKDQNYKIFHRSGYFAD